MIIISCVNFLEPEPATTTVQNTPTAPVITITTATTTGTDQPETTVDDSILQINNRTENTKSGKNNFIN
jgi:hypothetical protein